MQLSQPSETTVGAFPLSEVTQSAAVHALFEFERYGRTSASAETAGVAQLVEHRFCKPEVRGSSPLASSKVMSSGGINLEGCPSGQREQAVNLPASAYVGSNPSPSTNSKLLGVLDFKKAGVAQLVERQPSKLNVAGSNPVSRSNI